MHSFIYQDEKLSPKTIEVVKASAAPLTLVADFIAQITFQELFEVNHLVREPIIDDLIITYGQHKPALIFYLLGLAVLFGPQRRECLCVLGGGRQ